MYIPRFVTSWSVLLPPLRCYPPPKPSLPYHSFMYRFIYHSPLCNSFTIYFFRSSWWSHKSFWATVLLSYRCILANVDQTGNIHWWQLNQPFPPFGYPEHPFTHGSPLFYTGSSGHPSVNISIKVRVIQTLSGSSRDLFQHDSVSTLSM